MFDLDGGEVGAAVRGTVAAVATGQVPSVSWVSFLTPQLPAAAATAGVSVVAGSNAYNDVAARVLSGEWHAALIVPSGASSALEAALAGKAGAPYDNVSARLPFFFGRREERERIERESPDQAVLMRSAALSTPPLARPGP